jgi:nitrate/TMAO reductase-like tetraheme cytochrome c subunit
MKRWAWIGLATVVLGIWALTTVRPPRAAPMLDVFFTCDVRGRLVPCGCFSGQLGGLTRVATMIGLGAQPASLKVDAGDAIRGPADYEVIEYRHIQRAFAAMGYEALNVGLREAQLSAATLRELKRTAPVPMLGANLLDRATGQPILDAYRIVRRGAQRIAIVGVLDARGNAEALGDGLAIEDMEVTLGKLLPALRPQADCIVLLAFADETALTALARQFYELDVILGGNVKQPSQQLVRENRSLILATTNQSRALGTLRLRLGGPGKVAALRGEVVLVSEEIAQHPTITALAAEYRDEVRRTKLAIDDPATLQQDMVPGVKSAATYAGSAACTACHASTAHRWSESGHARAWAALVETRADADPSCIGCHSVGFGTPGGYRREFAGTKLTDVGCESCHGPGSQHVAQRQAGGEVTAHFRPLGAGDCVRCHHGEFSRPFDYAQFWPLIQHGKEAAISPRRETAH